MDSDSEVVVSPSLWKTIKHPPSPNTKKRIKKHFQLAPEGFEMADSEDEFIPPIAKKQKKLKTAKGKQIDVQSASSSKKVTPNRSTNRFGNVTTNDQLASASEGVTPKNTEKNDRWALSVFNDWTEQRNKRVSRREQCPENILQTKNLRKKDGSKYPPATIHMLLCGLQRIMRHKNAQPFDIFDKKDVGFRSFHGTMETVFQSLHSEGVGAVVKHAPLITIEEESVLWAKKILGDHTPLALVRGVFFLNGKNFCLRGGKEHRELKLSQLVKCDDHYKYIENGSKSFRGGVGDLRRENKIVRQYPCLEAGTACHVHLLDMYISKLPQAAKDKDHFYFTPLTKIPVNPNEPWYSTLPMGWNKLDRCVRDIFEQAGISGKTNHSLRVTGATRLYRGGIAEKTIQARTGHKSIEALRVYEWPGEIQHKEVLANVPSGTLKDATNAMPVRINAPRSVVPALPLSILVAVLLLSTMVR